MREPAFTGSTKCTIGNNNRSTRLQPGFIKGGHIICHILQYNRPIIGGGQIGIFPILGGGTSPPQSIWWLRPCCIYIFVLLQKQEYILQRDWSCCRSPSHDANSRLLCSEFHARMKRVNSKCSSVQLRANSAIYSRHSRLVWTHL